VTNTHTHTHTHTRTHTLSNALPECSLRKQEWEAIILKDACYLAVAEGYNALDNYLEFAMFFNKYLLPELQVHDPR